MNKTSGGMQNEKLLIFSTYSKLKLALISTHRHSHDLKILK